MNADKRSAIDWDKGITIIHRGRIYPDGRIVRYPEPTLKGMTPPGTSRAIGGRVDLDRVEKVIDARYLSLVEREQLRDLRRAGRSMRQVAAELGRSPSTISRELRRNTVSNREYLPHTAHRLSVQRRRRPRTPKILANAELRSYIEARLKKRWSPRQISRRMKKDFPDAPEMRVSTETIYQAIYVHARGELKRELAKQLRRGRTARKPQKRPDVRRPRFVDPMTSICQRPPTSKAARFLDTGKEISSSERAEGRPSPRLSNEPADSSYSVTLDGNETPTPCATASSTRSHPFPTPCVGA